MSQEIIFSVLIPYHYAPHTKGMKARKEVKMHDFEVDAAEAFAGVEKIYEEKSFLWAFE